MKKSLLVIVLSLIIPLAKAQKAEKWRVTEMDSLGIAQDMFDDQNFIMAIPYITAVQANHPQEPFLKYLAGICCLFKEETQKQGLDLLLEVYENNKKAEDIEFYLALGYHYNRDFVNGTIFVDKFLSHKYLNNAQRRAGEKLKGLCMIAEMMPIPADEGKLEDYLVTKAVATSEETK